MASQRSCSSLDWVTHGENDENDSDSEGSEFNEHCVDENIQNRDEFGGLRNILETEQTTKSLQMNLFDPNLSDDASIVESDSDGEISGGLWTNFRASTDMNDPEFTLGMTFASKQEFKDAVHNYAIKNGKDLKFVKNDKERFIVECKQPGCPFRISLRKVINSLSWRILKMEEKHEGCSWAFDNMMVNSTKIAKRWSKEINFHPDWKMLKFKEKVLHDDKVHMSERQTYRVLSKAKKILQGDEEENFNKLWSYVLEINRTNPMSTCSVKLSDFQEMNGDRRFLRFYMCWDACKKGFKFCRKLIGIDGTHLKTISGGVLLTAIGIDSNDSIFPLSYAIVEKEIKQSWTWFLELLKRDLYITDESEFEFTLISDKQKGLIPACESVLPKVEHRFCVRHLHGNMKVVGFQGKSLKDALWSCARAYTVTDFNRGFRHLKELDVNAFEWLADKHPQQWSRSHFSCASHSDMLVNNICECFNSVISEARQQPIIGCLETIRKLLMKKLYESREAAKRWNQSICPRILDKLAIIEKQAASYRGTQCDYHLFEIQGMYGDQQEVDLQRRSCSCRKWDLTGIPCKHAVCAIWLKKGVVLDYVDNCYSRDTYLKIYGDSIHPMAGAAQWPFSDKKPPLPPLYTARPGRPKKLRKRSADELTKDGVLVARKRSVDELTKDGLSVARNHIQLHCSICRKAGHNCRSCPDKTKRIPKQMKPRKRVIIPTVPVDVVVEDSTVVVPIEEDSGLLQIPVGIQVQEDVLESEQVLVETVTIHEQEIMNQEDLDFFNQFDFSTPFEDQPVLFEDQQPPVEGRPLSNDKGN